MPRTGLWLAFLGLSNVVDVGAGSWRNPISPWHGRRNPVIQRQLIVVDDFYPDPDAVREEAFDLEYDQPHPKHQWFVSTTGSARSPWVLGRLEQIMGETLYDALVDNAVSSVGRFQFSFAQASPLISVHSDPYMWAAILYLTPNPPPNSGTRFCRHRATGAIQRPGNQPGKDLRSSVPLNVSYELDQYESHLCIGNLYNRLVLFEGSHFHCAESFFGDSAEQARLTQTFFFNLGRSYRDSAGAPRER